MTHLQNVEVDVIFLLIVRIMSFDTTSNVFVCGWLQRWEHDTSILVGFGCSLHLRKHSLCRSELKISSVSSNDSCWIATPQSFALTNFLERAYEMS